MSPFRSSRMDDRSSLLLARVANLVTGVVAVVMAQKIPNVLDILLFAYLFWAPVILCPLAFALLGLRTTLPGFLAGCLSGIAGVCVWQYGLGAPYGYDGTVFGVFTNLLALVTVNSFAKSRQLRRNQSP